jgi:hypothetical protein
MRFKVWGKVIADSSDIQDRRATWTVALGSSLISIKGPFDLSQDLRHSGLLLFVR